MPEKQQNTIIKDMEDAYCDGVDQGWMYGFIASILGPDWPAMYNEGETERNMVKSAWLLAKEAKEKFKKDELAASGVLLMIAFDNYKAVKNGP